MKKTNSRRSIVIAFGLLLVLTQSALAQSGTMTDSRGTYRFEKLGRAGAMFAF